MKRFVGAVIALAFLAAGPVLAQTSEHTQSTTKSKGPGKNTKVKTETVTGTVKEYDAGKKITVTGPKNKDYSFDLNENAKVEGSIAVGGRAKVSYTKDTDGNHVTVLSEAKAGKMSPKKEKAAPTAEASTPSGGKMHMESTTKSGGTKEKTETVIGTVKEYEAGKKIKVTGPKDKDYSFDLDENVAMKGTVAVGDRVKVSYTKSGGGSKVTTVEPWTAKPAAKSKTKKTAA